MCWSYPWHMVYSTRSAPGCSTSSDAHGSGGPAPWVTTCTRSRTCFSCWVCQLVSTARLSWMSLLRSAITSTYGVCGSSTLTWSLRRMGRRRSKGTKTASRRGQEDGQMQWHESLHSRGRQEGDRTHRSDVQGCQILFVDSSCGLQPGCHLLRRTVPTHPATGYDLQISMHE